MRIAILVLCLTALAGCAVSPPLNDYQKQQRREQMEESVKAGPLFSPLSR